jgi:hypothetical protein
MEEVRLSWSERVQVNRSKKVAEGKNEIEGV